MKRMVKNIFLAFLFFIFGTGNYFGQTISESHVDDRTSVMITVYNNNLGLIKERRKILLPPGKGELRFMDVASRIIPETVHVLSLHAPHDFSVLEQSYEYDLMNENKLLDKYVGRKIKIINWNQYQDRKEEVEAVLLSNNQGQIYQINNEIYLGHPGYKVLPGIPENFISKPTLTWLYQNGIREAQEIEVSYLTENINWKADYILVLNKEETRASLSGWVTLDNRSGASYGNARLKLVAGELHRAEGPKLARTMGKDVMAAEAPGPAFKERGLFEYHIYDLQRKTTVKNNQTKQISLLEAGDIKIEKELLVHGSGSFFVRRYSDQSTKRPVNIYVKFSNTNENNIGIPLPAGIMKLYKEDVDGSQQFIGEDRIDHTPKDEETKLRIGEAFDIVAERMQTDYRRVTSNIHESEWEITLRNRKNENVTVGIIEPLSGNWKVIEHSHPYKKQDAFTIRFDVEVPRGAEVKVTYRVQVGI